MRRSGPRVVRWFRRGEQGFVVAEVACRQRWRQTQQQILRVVVDQAFAAGLVGVHRFRRIRRDLRQDAETGRLDEPANRARREEVDVPDTVWRIVLRASADVLGRDLHEHMARDARGLGEELTGVFEMLDDMA